MVSLFYCGMKQKNMLQMKTLKETCKRHNIKFNKSATKYELCNTLGKFLYESKRVVITDEEKDISFSNLTKKITE